MKYSKKTIPKKSVVVILLAIAAATFSSCQLTASKSDKAGSTDESAAYSAPKVVGELKSGEINESSGIAVSKCAPNVLWTHNDSGDGPFIYALSETGGSLGTWRVSGAENIDWEDIASYRDSNGRCYLYIGEIGNNEFRRNEMRIYMVPEPETNASTKGTKRNDALETLPATLVTFRYADGPHNAEALLVHPKTGDIYVLTKSRSETSGVYKIPAGSSGTVTAAKIGEISVPAIPDGMITGGDISPDGTRVVVCDYFAAYELILPDGKPFDEIWKAKPLRIELGKRKVGEAVGYSPDGRTIFATSEGKGSPLIRVDRK